MNFSSHFSKKTLRALAAKGVRLVGLTMLPGEGALPYATGQTGYCVDDNGCLKVWGFGDVLEAAA